MQATLERLRQRREEMGDEGGFTLIELLIVIVILGILAAIVVFAVQNLTGQSATASCQAQFKTVETALEAYKAQVGSYPAAGDTALNTTLESTGIVGLDGTHVGPWLKDVPPLAAGTSPYYIKWNGTAVQIGLIKGNGAKTNATVGGVSNCGNA